MDKIKLPKATQIPTSGASRDKLEESAKRKSTSMDSQIFKQNYNLFTGAERLPVPDEFCAWGKETTDAYVCALGERARALHLQGNPDFLSMSGEDYRLRICIINSELWRIRDKARELLNIIVHANSEIVKLQPFAEEQNRGRLYDERKKAAKELAELVAPYIAMPAGGERLEKTHNGKGRRGKTLADFFCMEESKRVTFMNELKRFVNGKKPREIVLTLLGCERAGLMYHPTAPAVVGAFPGMLSEAAAKKWLNETGTCRYRDGEIDRAAEAVKRTFQT